MSLTTQFLTQVAGFVRDQDGDSLRGWLLVEPPVPDTYYKLAQELQTGFRGDGKLLGALIDRSLPIEDDDTLPAGKGTAWPGLIAFIKDYLDFWRDVDFTDLLSTHQLLSALLTSCSSALSNPTYGTMMLGTCISFSQSLSDLAMMLHKQPELTLRLRSLAARSGGDEGRKSIVESTAEVIQKIFILCLTDRTSGRWAKPEGKKVGVYIFANKVLKLLFASRRTRLANQLFTNIASNSPPLSLYPASQRVAYLYYLGRFNLVNAHYARASAALSGALAQCPRRFPAHRRLILTFLIPANLLLGRLPSAALLAHPEVASPPGPGGTATALAAVFGPLAAAVRLGDFALLQHALAAHEAWLWDRGLLLALTYRLRPLVWRSLARRVFVLTYIAPPPPQQQQQMAQPGTAVVARRAATLDLADLLAAARFVQRRIEDGWAPSPAALAAMASTGRVPSNNNNNNNNAAAAAAAAPAFSRSHPPPPHVNSLFLKAVSNSAAAAATATAAPGTKGRKRAALLRPNEGLLWGGAGGGGGEGGGLEPTAADVEAVVAALVQQGLLHGFVAHGSGRFAVTGVAKGGGGVTAVQAGWPEVRQVLAARRIEDPEGGGTWEVVERDVPGWVVEG